MLLGLRKGTPGAGRAGEAAGGFRAGLARCDILHRVKRSWAVLVVGFLVVSACSDSGDEVAEPSPTTTGQSDDDLRCEANTALDGVYDKLSTPGVFDLSEAELEDVFLRRRAAIGTMVDVAESDAEASALEAVDANNRIVEPAYVEALTEHGDEVSEFGYHWAFDVFTSGGVSPAESEAYFEARNGGWPLLKAAAMCSRPELLGLPNEDLDGEAEAGTIVFDRLDGEDTGLWAVSSTGGEPVQIDAPDGWDDLDEPTVAPDGRTIVAIARRGGESPAVGLATGALSDGFTVRYETSDAEITCPRITSDGVLMATQYGYGTQPNLLLTVDGEDVSTMETPATDFYCAERTPTGELMLGAASEDRNEYGDFVRVDEDGSSLTLLYGAEDCNGVPSGLSPDARFELVVQSCDSPADSGLVLVDLAAEEGERIVEWTSAVAQWSPSGEWITFGIASADRPLSEGTSVWVVRRNGTGLRQVVDAPSSWPTWVADELPSPPG